MNDILIGRRHMMLRCGSLLAAAAAASVARRASASVLAQHQHLLSAKGVQLSVQDYAVPERWLVRDDGERVWMPTELNDGRPVVLNFIFTTCPGICPVMSHTFSQFQERLGTEREKVHMVSISIDPEQDTPARLREYAHKFSAGPQWQHYTGTLAASVAVQKAFNVYGGDKMNHNPLTLMRPAPGKPWARIDGFASAVDLVQQYMNLASMCETASR